jgi:hypothetical protein
MTSAASAPTITTTTLTQPPCVLTIVWGSALPPHQQQAWKSYWSSVFTRLLVAVNDPCSPHTNCYTMGGSQGAPFPVPSVY